MRKLKDIHVQMSEVHYDQLKKIAAERGFYALSSLIRSVLVEHLGLSTEEVDATNQKYPHTAAR